MDFTFPDVVNLMFSPTAGGITLGAGSIWLLVFAARQVAAPMSRWRAPCGGIGRWLSGPSGGFWLGGILAGAAAALKAASAGPMDGAAWASVVIAWGAAMGINSAAKRAPGLAQVERGRKRRAGLAAALALALGLTLTSTPAQASRLTFLGAPERTMAGEAPSLLDYLDLGASFGVEFRLLTDKPEVENGARSLDVRPALQLLGGLGLADVGPVQLSVVTGGQYVLSTQGGDAAFIFGASAGWKRGPLKLGVFVGAAFRGTQSLVAGFVVSG